MLAKEEADIDRDALGGITLTLCDLLRLKTHNHKSVLLKPSVAKIHK